MEACPSHWSSHWGSEPLARHPHEVRHCNIPQNVPKLQPLHWQLQYEPIQKQQAGSRVSILRQPLSSVRRLLLKFYRPRPAEVQACHQTKPLPEERQPKKLLGKRCRFKGKGSQTWTPIRVGRVTPKLADRLENLVHLNRHANPKNPAQWKCFSLSHPRYGTDVLIRCDRGPPVVYDCQKDEATELTDAELKYLWWNLDCLRPELFADAMRSFHSLKHRLIDESGDYVHGHLRRYHRQRNDDWLTYDPSDDDTDEL